MGAEVRAADPHVVEQHGLDPRIDRVELDPEEVAAADAVVLLTDHDVLRPRPGGRARRGYVLDTPPPAERPDRRGTSRKSGGHDAIVCVAGARPNFMKIKPVMDALERRGAEVALVHTGQHYDAAMNDVFFTDLGIRPPDRLPRTSARAATRSRPGG